MPRYHLFYLTCENARCVDSAIVEAPDDDSAVALAEGDFVMPLELWSGYDRVKRFERAPRVDATNGGAS